MSSFPATLAALRSGRQFFEPGQPVYYTRAPGRLDLMGGNDDYTGGLVFEATIREPTWAAVQRRADRRISSFGIRRLAGAAGSTKSGSRSMI